MRTNRGSPLWIVGRLGILIVFGVIPLMRICDRARKAPFWEAVEKCRNAYTESYKYPVLSDGWNTNKAIGDYWFDEQERLYKKFYGKKP